MVNPYLIKSYKKCQKKQYDIHVCKPPVGTIVINKLEQADVVADLGKDFFTLDEQAKLAQTNPAQYQKLTAYMGLNRLYVVNKNTPYVLAGTIGEMWCVDANKLSKSYMFSNGEPITDVTLKKHEKHNNIMPWQSIRVASDNSILWACFVPVPQVIDVKTAWGTVLYTNLQGVNHGKGDFIVASDATNCPNYNDRWVVNGNIFAKTYNNKGWTDCLVSNSLPDIKISDLPNLIKNATKSRH